jgi:hypothetical protein
MFLHELKNRKDELIATIKIDTIVQRPSFYLGGKGFFMILGGDALSVRYSPSDQDPSASVLTIVSESVYATDVGGLYSYIVDGNVVGHIWAGADEVIFKKNKTDTDTFTPKKFG